MVHCIEAVSLGHGQAVLLQLQGRSLVIPDPENDIPVRRLHLIGEPVFQLIAPDSADPVLGKGQPVLMVIVPDEPHVVDMGQL